MILGIDEVGRGSWAGPLVVGAVVLGGVQIKGLTDSKLLNRKQREDLDIEIRAKAAAIGVGWVDADEIDQVGLARALSVATERAVEQVNVPYDEIIIDGTVNFLKDTNKAELVTAMKKADLLVPCVSAASIIAKVARDKFMTTQDAKYRNFGFKNNVGYGTTGHNQAIKNNGLTPLHRFSYAPIKSHLAQSGFMGEEGRTIVTKDIGDRAEDEATKYLINQGHHIVDRNWKTRFCEIDIVSQYGKMICFTEVKYRKKSDQGGGLAAITNKKLNQMKFAAEYYCTKNDIEDTQPQLAVISLIGTPPKIETYLHIE